MVEQLRKERARSNRLMRDNKRLRSQLKKQRNVESEYLDLIQEADKEMQIPKGELKPCTECEGGSIEVFTIGKFNFERCSLCSFQRRKK